VKGFFGVYLQVTGLLYVALMTNLLLLVANLPLVALVVFTDVSQTWLLVVGVAPFAAPSVVAAFAVFREFSTDGRVTVVRTFARRLSVVWRRSLGIGALASAGLLVIGADIAFVWGKTIGAAAIPVFVMFMALLLATAFHVLIAIDLEAEVRGLDLWKASLFLTVRHWPLTALSLFALGLLSTFVVVMPAWGLGLAVSPALYLAWTNGTYVLRPKVSAPTVQVAA